MKKVLFFALTISLLSACGGNDSKKLAQDVCDCYKKANDMPATDPNRSQAQKDCLTKQSASYDKIKGDSKKSAEFNQIISDCGKEMLKKSIGQ